MLDLASHIPNPLVQVEGCITQSATGLELPAGGKLATSPLHRLQNCTVTDAKHGIGLQRRLSSLIPRSGAKLSTLAIKYQKISKVFLEFCSIRSTTPIKSHQVLWLI